MIRLGDGRVLVQLDSRGRVTLPGVKPHQKYRATEHEDGTIVLEPVNDDE